MKYLFALFSICCIVAATCYTAQAAPAVVKGITVSPAIEQISLSQNQTSATFTSQITNNTTAPVILSIGAKDFTALNETGGVGFLRTSSPDSTSHGLANSLLITHPQVTLSPGQSQMIPITIQNVNKLASGGHYAALTYKLQNVANGKGNNVSVEQTVSSLIFLSTNGEGTQTSELTTPVIGSFFTTFPKSLNVVFANSGNTQTTPRGVVQILNSSSKVVSQAIVNVDSSLILPQSSRLFNLSLIPQGTVHLSPGIYTLRITYNHDGHKGATIYQQKFLFLNKSIVIVVIFVVLVGVIVLARKFLPSHLYYRIRRQP
jgi:hypothetical protein